MSLLGFLFGPGLNAAADVGVSWAGQGAVSPVASARVVIVLTAVLGAVTMLGLAWTLPAARVPAGGASKDSRPPPEVRMAALYWLSGVVTLVLAAFELGIVLQGQQHAGMSSREVATMFAECSLVMLGVNALLFLTGLLEKISSRTLMAAGLILAASGLAVMAWHSTRGWLFGAVAQVSFGWLIVPLVVMLVLLLLRPHWWSVIGAAIPSRPTPPRPARP